MKPSIATCSPRLGVAPDVASGGALFMALRTALWVAVVGASSTSALASIPRSAAAPPYLAPSPAACIRAQDDPFAGTVLEIDGQAVPLSTFCAWLLELQGRELQQRFLDHVLLQQECEKRGVLPTDAEVEAATRAAIEERINKGFRGDQAVYEAELARMGSDVQQDFDRRRVLVETQLRRSALARAERGEPDEAALAALHQVRYGIDGRELTVRAIRLMPAVPEPAPGEDEAARAARVAAARQAQELRLSQLAERIRAGADVAALARELSEDPETRLADGLLSVPFDRRQWPKEVNAALAALPPGEPSAPLFGRGYLNLFVIESARPAPLAEVRESLLRELLDREPDEGEQRVAYARVRAAAAPEMLQVRAIPQGWRGTPRELLDEPLVRLGDQLWTYGDLAYWIARDRGSDLARVFVRDWRLARLVRDARIELDSADIDRRAAATFALTLRQVYGGDRARMGRDLERRYLTEEHLLARFTREAWRDAAIDGLLRESRVVTDEDVRLTWEERYGPLGKSYDLRVLVRHLEGRDEAAEHAQLTTVVREARSGADFGALAARWSDDPITRERGGRPNGRFRHEDAPEALRRVVEALEPGETSDPLRVGEQLVLLHLVAVERVPLGEVAEELRKELEERETTVPERTGFLMSLDLDEHCVVHRSLLAPR